MGSYALLFAISLWMNRRDGKMLLLTFFVGGGIFFPIPDDGFYVWCIAVEIVVAFAADLIDAVASRLIVWLSFTLAIFHMLGKCLNGYPPESPYHVLVVASEHAEFIVLILLSEPFLKKVKQCPKSQKPPNGR